MEKNMAVVEFGESKIRLADLVGPTNPNQYNPNKYAYAGRYAVKRPTEDLAVRSVHNLDPDIALAYGVITPTQKRYYEVVGELEQLTRPGRVSEKNRTRKKALLEESMQLDEMFSERR